MGNHPQGTQAAQSLHQTGGEDGRMKGDGPGAQANQKPRPCLPESGHQLLHLPEGGGQGVAARKQHLLHLRVGGQICGHLINFLGCRPPKAGATGRLAASSLQGLRDEALPKAVAAVGKAAAGGKHQHPVLVLVHHALCSLMEAGSQGICKLFGQHQIFF